MCSIIGYSGKNSAAPILVKGLQKMEYRGYDSVGIATETGNKIVDDCLQFFGGYGYMSEYPISRLFVDSRARRIYGGSSEIMKLVIGRSI